jgi:hypothetical protein
VAEREAEGVLIFVSGFKPVEKPKQEADLQTEIKYWTAVGVDGSWIVHEITIAAVDDIDVQADEGGADKIPDWEDEV